MTEKVNKYLVTIHKKQSIFTFKTSLSFVEIIKQVSLEDSLNEAGDNLIEFKIKKLGVKDD